MGIKQILVTGGCGFIGSQFVKSVLERDDSTHIVNLDLLTYAGDPSNVGHWAKSPLYTFVKGDIRDASLVDSLVPEVEWVVNFAAESHVDRSTGTRAGEFVETNVYGTFVLLDAVRRLNPEARFLQIGTDEVYGDVDAPGFPDETSMLEPSSPYSASKAGADQIALSFARTHGMDVRVSRCTNNYGAFQHPEKLIPLFITNALDGLPLPLYDGGTQIRDWLRVHDHCEALQTIMQKGRPGEIYNVGANQQPEKTNAEITSMILHATGASESLIEHRHGLRPGHDQRYAVSTDKLRGLGWEPQLDIEQGILETVEWYKKNRDWWQARKDDSYQAYYAEHYGRSADPGSPSDS